jgi:DNA-binding transcriptional ArsR family regulator
MDNHYHLIIETPKPSLSIGMRQLNGVYTQAFNRKHRRVGHLFQGRFKAILVEKETYLLELCRYVVLNPVRAKVVRHPRQWRWSSYGATAGEGSVPDFLSVEWILGQFGDRKGRAQERYRGYVEEGIGGESPWEKLSGQIYLGSEGFVAKHQPDQPIKEIPHCQTQANRPELEELFGERKGLDQAIQEAYVRYGYRMGEIAEHLGVHYSTVSRHFKKVESKGMLECKT